MEAGNLRHLREDRGVGPLRKRRPDLFLGNAWEFLDGAFVLLGVRGLWRPAPAGKQPSKGSRLLRPNQRGEPAANRTVPRCRESGRPHKARSTLAIELRSRSRCGAKPLRTSC